MIVKKTTIRALDKWIKIVLLSCSCAVLFANRTPLPQANPFLPSSVNTQFKVHEAARAACRIWYWTVRISELVMSMVPWFAKIISIKINYYIFLILFGIVSKVTSNWLTCLGRLKLDLATSCYSCRTLSKCNFLFQQTGYFTCRSLIFLHYFRGLTIIFHESSTELSTF